ncbi:MAG TPA: hypothetical protein VGB54_04195 [Allosphingosinicella sp.]
MRYRWDNAMIFCAATAGLMLLSACGGSAEANLAQMDNQIAAADIDPAVTTAIEDEILVDPALVQQSNPNGVRHPERPLQAPYPVETRRAGAPMTEANGAVPTDPTAQIAGACGAPFQYGPEWAERLPADFPPYPGGRVTEAAGNNAGNCRMRVVTFVTEHSWQQVLDWYRGAVTRAGFNFEHQVRGADHVLGGVNERNDGAYYLIVTPEQGGSKVALIVNNGR